MDTQFVALQGPTNDTRLEDTVSISAVCEGIRKKRHQMCPHAYKRVVSLWDLSGCQSEALLLFPRRTEGIFCPCQSLRERG